MTQGTPVRWGSIAGTVTCETGAPLAGAVVAIGGESPTHRDIGALTDDGGRYRFERLVPGRYTLMVNAEGYAMATRQVSVEAGEEARLDFTCTR